MPRVHLKSVHFKTAVILLLLIGVGAPRAAAPAQAQDALENALFLPLVLAQEPVASPVTEPDLLEVGANPAAVAMVPGEPTAIPELQQCFSIGFDYLMTVDGHDTLFMLVTCQESDGVFGNRAYVVDVPHLVVADDGTTTGGWAAAELHRLTLDDTMSDPDKDLARVVSSLKAEPIIQEEQISGWSIIALMDNKTDGYDASLFWTILTRAQVEQSIAGSEPTFVFDVESILIPNSKMRFLSHRPEQRMSFQEDYLVILASAGRAATEVFDHSSGFHIVRIARHESPTDLAKYEIAKQLLSDGSIEWLSDPWVANEDYVDAWDAANRNANNPVNGWALPLAGTYTELSGKPDTFHGGAVCYTPVPGGEPVCIVIDAKGSPAWHHDLSDPTEKDEQQRRPALFALAFAGLWTPKVDAGEVFVDEIYGTGEHSAGYTAVPYIQPVLDAEGQILEYRVIILSAVHFGIHYGEANLSIGY